MDSPSTSSSSRNRRGCVVGRNEKGPAVLTKQRDKRNESWSSGERETEQNVLLKVSSNGRPDYIRPLQVDSLFPIALETWRHAGGRFIIHYQRPLAREFKRLLSQLFKSHKYVTVCHRNDRPRYSNVDLLDRARGPLIVHVISFNEWSWCIMNCIMRQTKSLRAGNGKQWINLEWLKSATERKRQAAETPDHREARLEEWRAAQQELEIGTWDCWRKRGHTGGTESSSAGEIDSCVHFHTYAFTCSHILTHITHLL